jgi:hypothetical protein
VVLKDNENVSILFYTATEGHKLYRFTRNFLQNEQIWNSILRSYFTEAADARLTVRSAAQEVGNFLTLISCSHSLPRYLLVVHETLATDEECR